MRRLLLVLGLTAAACQREPAPGPGALAVGDAPVRILLVTIDTMRADRLGCYGYEAAQTPHLDALAAAGVRMDRAYAPVPLTLPSHASLLTGTQPPEHGLRDNGSAALPAELTTLAEVFRERGYRTGAVTAAAVLDSAFGLDRGFEHYDDEDEDASRERIFVRNAETVTDRALAWLDGVGGDEPFLLWVHYYDPHSAYEPPPPFRDRLEHPYDGEVAYVDHNVGRLVARLRARGWDEDTLTIVTSDHGESLGEHGERTHGVTIYEATQRVPMTFTLPGRIAPGTSDHPVELRDVLPTLMELFDLPVPATSSGNSFARALIGERLEPWPIYAESEYSRRHFGWSSLRTITTDGYRYHASSQPELYHLPTDPGELRDLIADEPERAAQLRAELERYEGGLVRRSGVRVTNDPELNQALLGLGYSVGGEARDEQEDPYQGRSPRSGVELLNRYHEAGSLAKIGRHREVVELLAPVVESCPDAAAFRTVLGASYRQLGRVDEALEHLAEAVNLDPLFEPAHFELGVALAQDKQTEKARKHFDVSTRLNPTNHLSHLNAAVLAASQGELEPAAEHYAALVELRPDDARFRANYGYVLRALERYTEMVEQFERALAAAPGDVDLQRYVAWLLATHPSEEVRDGARALEIARELVRGAGAEDPARLDVLAAAQAELGRFPAAVDTAERALELARSQVLGELEQALAQRLESYRAREPWRE